jgi:outer membrane protein assembly factor BamD (BamD/ComL family)
MSERRFAILIGNSIFLNERRLADLRLPGKDVDGLRDVLESADMCGFFKVTVLKDEPADRVRLDIAKTLLDASAEDLVLIYYSGHGKVDLEGRLHLATSDTELHLLPETSLVVEHLLARLKGAKSKKKILILDCCYSGAVANAFFKGENPVDVELERLPTLEGTCVLTSSSELQPSIEKEGDPFSLLTKYIIEGIRTRKAANSLGVVSIGGLFEYVKENIVNESPQIPTIHTKNINASDLIIVGSVCPGQLRRRKILDRLTSLFDQMDQKINLEAYKLIQINSESTREQKEKFSLLEDLDDDEITLVEFETSWREIDVSQIRIGEYFDAAEAAAELEDWNEAEDRLQQIISIDPDHAEASVRLAEIQRNRVLARDYAEARLLLNSGDFSGALSKLETLQSVSPSYKDVSTLIEEIQSNLAARTAKVAERRRLAREAEATKRKQEDLARLYQQGRSFFDAGEWEEASDRFRKVRNINGNYQEVEAYLTDTEALLDAELMRSDVTLDVLAKMRLRLQNLPVRNDNVSKVAECLRSLNERIERNLLSLYEQAQKAMDQHQWTSALERFERIQKVDSNYMLIRELIQRVNERKGTQRADQIQLQTEPKSSASHIKDTPDKDTLGQEVNRLYREACADMAKEEWDTAIEKLERAQQIYSSNAEIAMRLRLAKGQQQLAGFYSAGKSHMAARDWQSALNNFSRVITIEPHYKDVDDLLELSRRKGKPAVSERIIKPVTQSVKVVFVLLLVASGLVAIVVLALIFGDSARVGNNLSTASPTPFYLPPRLSTLPPDFMNQINRMNRQQEEQEPRKVKVSVQVRGKSNSSRSTPLNAANVMVRYDDIGSQYTRVTDSTGVAIAEAVPCGRSITIEVTAEGMRDQSKKVFLSCRRAALIVPITLEVSEGRN